MKNSTAQPIGFFDSGVGGTSIWRAVQNYMPDESTIYLADNKYAPYGRRSQQEIIELSVKNTEYLLKEKCKLIVVACNTATTNAIQFLRKHYQVPFIGIEPAIKPAALKTETQSIGILATEGTITSSLFHETSMKWANNVQVHKVIGKGIVELMESGKMESEEMRDLLQTYLLPLKAANVDCLVLGCTHYPYLIPIIQDILPKNINIIDNSMAIAMQTNKVLKQLSFLNNSGEKPVYRFLANGPVTHLKAFLKDIPIEIQIEQQEF